MTDFVANRIYIDSRLAAGTDAVRSSQNAAASEVHAKRYDRPPPLIYHSRSSPFPTAGRESLFRSEAAGMKKQRLMKDSCQISFPKHKTKPNFPYLCCPNCVNKKQLHTK